MKDDLISKTAAIDAVEEIPWYHQNKNGEMVHGANSREHQAWYKADDIYHALYTLPSAQQVPWDRKTRNSMAGTLQMLRRLAYNIHGVMDVIDDDNVKRLTKWLEGGQE